MSEQWEVRYFEMPASAPSMVLPAGWEPFGVDSGVFGVLARRRIEPDTP